jgi:hypothetical protein
MARSARGGEDGGREADLHAGAKPAQSRSRHLADALGLSAAMSSLKIHLTLIHLFPLGAADFRGAFFFDMSVMSGWCA